MMKIKVCRKTMQAKPQAAANTDVCRTLEGQMTAFPTPVDKLDLILHLLDALQAFHRSGKPHLDVCPGSVTLTDRVGLRRPRGSVAHRGVSLNGDPHYSAPEVRLRDRRSVGVQSDLFSVSSILYELVTGYKLAAEDVFFGFRADADKAIRKAAQGNAAAERLLRRILRKGLQIVPTQRYQNCEAMRADVAKLRAQLVAVGTAEDADAK